MRQEKVVITYGTFDIFHIGHLNLIKRLKSIADKLIVAVSTDEFNEMKGKVSTVPFKDRKEILEAIKYIDLVIDEVSWEQKVADIKKYNVSAFAIGDDWQGHFDFLKEHCAVLYLERTAGVSTTQIKESIKK